MDHYQAYQLLARMAENDPTVTRATGVSLGVYDTIKHFGVPAVPKIVQILQASNVFDGNKFQCQNVFGNPRMLNDIVEALKRSRHFHGEYNQGRGTYVCGLQTRPFFRLPVGDSLQQHVEIAILGAALKSGVPDSYVRCALKILDEVVQFAPEFIYEKPPDVPGELNDFFKGRLDSEGLDEIAAFVEDSSMKLVTDRTGSESISRFGRNGTAYYVKMGSHAILWREYNALLAKQKHPLTNVILPTPACFIEGGDASVLVTKQSCVEELGEGDLADYVEALSYLTIPYAEARDINPAEFMADPATLDTFNKAIIHTLMKAQLPAMIMSMGKPYRTYVPFVELAKKVQDANPEALDEFLRFGPNYETVFKLLSMVPPNDQDRVVAHNDFRPENTIDMGMVETPAGAINLRGVVDCGPMSLGTADTDLAKTETEIPMSQGPLYIYFRTNLERRAYGNDFEYSDEEAHTLFGRTTLQSVMHTVRSLAFMYEKGRDQDVVRLSALAENTMEQVASANHRVQESRAMGSL